jgi:hypothetical protein
LFGWCSVFSHFYRLDLRHNQTCVVALAKLTIDQSAKKKNTGLGVGPPLIWLWLSEVHVC